MSWHLFTTAAAHSDYGNLLLKRQTIALNPELQFNKAGFRDVFFMLELEV